MIDKELKGKNILFVVAFNDYQDIEYKNTKNILKQNGAKIDVCSSSQGIARGKYGGEIKIDLLINNVDISDYDAVVFIGGPGAVEYLNNNYAYDICRKAIELKILLGAICLAPQILAKSGILKNRNAVVFSSEVDKSGLKTFTEEQVNFIDQDVVSDGNIITARGPEASEKFGQAIINQLNKSK